VHPVSGSAYGYGGLAGLLPAEQPVYGLEAPGFDDDREPLDSVPALAADHVRTLDRLLPGLIGGLLGWSTGGLVAYEMAALLAAAGRPVPALILVDSPAPAPAPLPAEQDIVRQFVHDLLGTAGAVPADLAAALGPRPDLPAAVFESVERAGLFPAEMDAEFLANRYHVFRASVVAMYAYRPDPGGRRPVTLVVASGSRRDLMRWAEVTGPVTEEVLPGDHYSIWSGAALAELGRLVRRCLDEVPAATPAAGG
jgi:thioesterase domain-containing protein